MSTEKNDLSRRGFLISSAAALAAASVANAQSKPAATTPSTKSPTTTEKGGRPGRGGGRNRDQQSIKEIAATRKSKYSDIRVAVIGIDGRGASNLRELVEAGATIGAVCDIDSQKLDKAASQLPSAKKFADFREMLDKEGKNLDAVLVSTPDHTHAPAAMMAMRMGKHCYCEKPLTYDIHEARTLTEAARRYKVKTQMGNQGAARDESRRQVEYVRSGIVGAIKEVHVYTDRPIWPQGLSRPTKSATPPSHINFDLWLGPAPERPYHIDDKGDSVYLPFKWRGWWDFGTGALGDMACHLMNTAFWSLNLTNPASVEAISSDKTDVQAPNWSIIKYDFPQLGQRPPVKVFWYDGKLLPANSIMKGKRLPGQQADGGGAPNGTIFVGEKGTIVAGYMENPYLLDDQQQKDLKPPEKTVPRSIGHHAEWLESILGGPDAASYFDHAGPLTEMVLLGNLAVRTGGRIEWDAKNMKVKNNREAQQYVKREYRKGWEL
jgi:predicted dehydrogenase